MLDAVEAEPAQPGRRPRWPVGGDRPGPGSVVGEITFAGAADIEDGVLGDAVTVQVGQRVVGQAVAVEIQADRVEPTVAVEVEIRAALPHGRCAVTSAQAVLHVNGTQRRG